MKTRTVFFAVLSAVAVLLSNADAASISEIFYFTKPAPSSPVQELNGLSAKAIFFFDTENAMELKIELSNTSTGLPTCFDNADQILTTISFDIGQAGINNDPEIITGIVKIGALGQSIDFDKLETQLCSGDDVTGEWGYGNRGKNGMLANYVTATKSGAIPFGGPNLDGPPNIDGPQGGIITCLPAIDPGGLGVIADSVLITLQLDKELSGLDFLSQNGVMVEFGSDAAFLVPEPSTIVLLGMGVLTAIWGHQKKSP